MTDEPRILSVTTQDTFTIRGRGIVHTVTLPDEFVQRVDPRTLVGQDVILDGERVRVSGVEASAISWTPGRRNSVLRNVGLLVQRKQ